MCSILTVCGIVFFTLSPCSAQAPGDGDERCTSAEDAPTYPDTIRNLMDSYNYEQLLPGSGIGNPPIEGAVWTDRSVDGNDAIGTTNPTYWQHGGGGICRYQARVCGWNVRRGQDNWLFTQHISQDFDPNTYNYPVEIQVELVHALPSCRVRFGCNPKFELYYYATNTTQLPITAGNGFMNIDNYVRFKVVKPADTTSTFTRIFPFTLQSNVTGFYFAIRDNGTCVGISRVRVFRNICQSFQSGLVLYPDAPAPVSGSENITISCVPNAIVSGSAQVTCNSNGTWGLENPVCECQPGYEDRETKCFTCPAGKYRSMSDTTCQQCPGNTVMDQEAAAQCECLDGYFRNDENRVTDSRVQPLLSPAIEQPSTACIQSPSAPGSLTLTAQQSSITVVWSSPAVTGGRSDLYYEVEHSDPDNLGTYTGTDYVNGVSTRRKVFSGLTPDTQYCVRVIAHNGVSDQDPDGTRLRTVEECTTTVEGRPGIVTGVQGTYPYVVWNPPQQPNGVITGYSLTFTRSGTSRTVTTSSNETFYVIQSTDIPWTSGPFTVKIEARTSVGFGSASSQYTLSIDGQPTCPLPCPTCPTCPMTTCPTCPTCPPPACPTHDLDTAVHGFDHTGTVHVDDIRVLGCGVISWKPPRGNEGDQLGYVVRFSDDNSNGGYRSLQRYFEDIGRQWAVADNLPIDGRTVYAEIRARNSSLYTSPFSGRVQVANDTVCPPTTTTCPVLNTTSPTCPTPVTCPPTQPPPTCSPPPTSSPPVLCPAKTVGLVRYPTTLAPASGTQSVTTQCADNAHRTSSSLSVTCSSSGIWGGQTPQCQCDSGYQTATVNERQICSIPPHLLDAGCADMDRQITISGGMTFIMDSDLNGANPQFTLTCISTGVPATTVTWTRGSNTITKGTDTILDDQMTAQYTHTLTVTGRLGGLYTCTVANDKPSEDSANFTVKVASAPTNLMAVQEGLTSIRVSWSPPTPLGDTNGYRIYYSDSGSVNINGGSTNNYLLTGLQNGDTYTISIVATSQHFFSENISTATVTLGTDITPSSTATSETTSIVAIIGGMLVVAILIISVAVIVVAVTRSKNRCGFVTTNKNEANMADLSTNAPSDGAPITTANPAYEIMKQGGGQSSEYELINVSAGADPCITRAEGKAYETPALPPSHPSLPAIPTVEDMDVAGEVKADVVYDSIQ